MGITTIIGFIKSPIGKYLIAIVGLLVLFIGLRSHFIHQGQLEGLQSATDSISAQREKEREQDRKLVEQTISQANVSIAAAQKQIDAATHRELLASQAIQALSQQRQQAQIGIQKLPDTQLHGFIVSSIGLREPNDTTPGYTNVEERTIASCIADEPLCKRTTQEQDNRIKSIQDQIDGLRGQLADTQKKYDILVPYVKELERNYTSLYNSFPRKGNTLVKILTFGLAGKPKKISTPDPSVLIKGSK